MQRENFIIICDNGTTATKHKWNSANREVENMVRDIAHNETTIYTLTGSTSEKVDGYHIKGSRQWTGKNGKVLNFTIEKV